MKGLHFLLLTICLASFMCFVFGQDSENIGDSGQPPRRERFLLPGKFPWIPLPIPLPAAAATTTGAATGSTTGGTTRMTGST